MRPHPQNFALLQLKGCLYVLYQIGTARQTRQVTNVQQGLLHYTCTAADIQDAVELPGSRLLSADVSIKFQINFVHVTGRWVDVGTARAQIIQPTVQGFA